MFSEIFVNWALPILRVSTPLIFAALGGMWCERSGVIQIGLEGYILVGSFFGAVSTLYFSNPYLGLFIAGLSGVVLSLLYGVSVLRFRANQIVAGTATNLFALGIPPFLSKIWYDSTGSTPPIPGESQFHSAPLYFMGITVALSYLFYRYSRFGLRLRFAGEHPHALQSAGVSVDFKRWQGVMISGFPRRDCRRNFIDLSFFFFHSKYVRRSRVHRARRSHFRKMETDSNCACLFDVWLH